MTESGSLLLSAEDLKTAKRDLQSANSAISTLPSGFIKQRMEAALKDADTEIQSQLWQHLEQPKHGGGSSAASAREAPATGEGGVGGSVPVGRSGGRYGGPMTPTGEVLEKAHRARVKARSPLHAAALALHCLLTAEGFVCTGQDDKAGVVKGFAPPVRDVPEEKLVPEKWDADGAAVSFRYRCPDNPGKVYLFKAASYGEGGPTSFFLAERGGETYSAGVDLAPLRCTDTIDFSDESFFERLFATFRREVLSHFLPEKRSAPEPVKETIGDPNQVVPASDRRPPPPGNPQPSRGMDEDDPLRAGPPRFAGPPGVGPTPFVPGRAGDFGGDLFPGGSGGMGDGRLPGAGGLLGPGHPMFGGGGGAGYMQPRFDPYGPPMPGQPWGPGVPGRPGRSGGRPGEPDVGSNRGPDGGPDNDHLPPPRGSDNMYF